MVPRTRRSSQTARQASRVPKSPARVRRHLGLYAKLHPGIFDLACSPGVCVLLQLLPSLCSLKDLVPSRPPPIRKHPSHSWHVLASSLCKSLLCLRRRTHVPCGIPTSLSSSDSLSFARENLPEGTPVCHEFRSPSTDMSHDTKHQRKDRLKYLSPQPTCVRFYLSPYLDRYMCPSSARHARRASFSHDSTEHQTSSEP